MIDRKTNFLLLMLSLVTQVNNIHAMAVKHDQARKFLELLHKHCVEGKAQLQGLPCPSGKFIQEFPCPSAIFHCSDCDSCTYAIFGKHPSGVPSSRLDEMYPASKTELLLESALNLGVAFCNVSQPAAPGIKILRKIYGDQLIDDMLKACLVNQVRQCTFYEFMYMKHVGVSSKTTLPEELTKIKVPSSTRKEDHSVLWKALGIGCAVVASVAIGNPLPALGVIASSANQNTDTKTVKPVANVATLNTVSITTKQPIVSSQTTKLIQECEQIKRQEIEKFKESLREKDIPLEKQYSKVRLFMSIIENVSENAVYGSRPD